MNDMLDDMNWAPPVLANHSTDSAPTVTVGEEWNGVNPNVLSVLTDLPGFRATYLVDAPTRTCSKVLGERQHVTEPQILAAMASMAVEGFEYVTYTLDDLYVLVRVCEKPPYHGVVLILARDEGNPALASTHLKKLCSKS